MRRRVSMRAGGAGLAALLALTSCGLIQGNKAGTFAAVGGGACSVAASSIGRGSGWQRAARGLLAGGTCAAIGGAIGAMLDEQDRQQMQQTTYALLRQPVPATYRQAYYRQAAQPAYASNGYGAYSPSRPTRRASSSGAAPRASFSNEGTAAAPVSPPAPAGRLPGVPKAPEAEWVSDHSGASGSATLVGMEPPTADHGECKIVRIAAQAPGQGAQAENQKFCESQAGADDWKEL